MNLIDKQTQDIIDFIYNKPELVLELLNEYGYDLSASKATLNDIYELTFKELSVKNNEKFAQELQDLISNDGYLNIAPLIVMAGASLVSSTISGLFGNKQAKKQRDLAFKMKLAEIATNEKISYEQIKTQAETDRIQILSNTLLQYRTALQKESTTRLKDTWIYVVGLGLAMGIIYGFTLVVSKKE